MLAHIAPTAKKPDQVVVFSKPGCPFCVEAKALLDEKGYAPIEIPLENKVRGRVIGAVSGKGTAPQVRSEEHTPELQSLMRISYAVFCLKKNTQSHAYISYTIPYQQ